MALTLRFSEEDEKQLKEISENVGLMQIDIVRAAVRAVLVAAKENGGTLEFPMVIVSKQRAAKNAMSALPNVV